MLARVRTLVVAASAIVACAPPPAAAPATAASGAARPQRLQNRPPKAFCKHELQTLGQEYGDGAFDVDVDPVEPGEHARRVAKPPKQNLLPRRKVLVENKLPASYVIEGLVFPSSAQRVRIEGAPPAGPIAEIDGRGARGPVAALVRRKFSGGLYEYVGDCQVVRDDIEVLPWDPRVPVPKKLDDVVLVLELIDNRPTLRVEGVPLGEGIRPTDVMMRF